MIFMFKIIKVIHSLAKTEGHKHRFGSTPFPSFSLIYILYTFIIFTSIREISM